MDTKPIPTTTTNATTTQNSTHRHLAPHSSMMMMMTTSFQERSEGGWWCCQCQCRSQCCRHHPTPTPSDAISNLNVSTSTTSSSSLQYHRTTSMKHPHNTSSSSSRGYARRSAPSMKHHLIPYRQPHSLYQCQHKFTVSSFELRTMGMMILLTFLLSIVLTIDYRLNHYMQLISQTILYSTSTTTSGSVSSSSSSGTIRNSRLYNQDHASPLNDKTLQWDNEQFPHAWLAYEQQQREEELSADDQFRNNTDTTNTSTTGIPKPPYMILLTEYGWNHPDSNRGLTFARSIRSTEYMQAIVNHPYFHPTAYHEIMITQTRMIDPNLTYYVFLDIETCYETNYPNYRKSYSGNCDRTGHRQYYSYTYIKYRRPPTGACYNLDHPHCHFIPTEIHSNPILTSATSTTTAGTNPTNGSRNKLVVFDCRGNGQNVLFRHGPTGNSTSLALVSLSSTAQQLNGQIDQGLPPPSIQQIPYSPSSTSSSSSSSSSSQYDQEINCDCDAFLQQVTHDNTTNIHHSENVMAPPPPRKYLLSFSGDYQRHPVRQELAKLDTVRTTTITSSDRTADTSSTTTRQEHDEKPLVLITDSKELHQNTNGLSYSELLLASQFVAVPRGDNLFSYRFSEVLSSGAIPVLIHNTEWVLPFRPEIVDWNLCVIWIAADQIHTTIARLQSISSYEQCQRRQYCYQVYETYMKNSSATIQGILDGLQAIAVQ